jgi:hypothetical protein
MSASHVNYRKTPHPNPDAVLHIPTLVIRPTMDHLIAHAPDLVVGGSSAVAQGNNSRNPAH